MAEFSREPAREEEEFWERQFRDPPRPRRASRTTTAVPQRKRRRARASASQLTRLRERIGDRLSDWRHDARLGVVVLIAIALIAGVIWYRIGIGGASAGESGAPPTAVTTAPSTTL